MCTVVSGESGPVGAGVGLVLRSCRRDGARRFDEDRANIAFFSTERTSR